MRPDQEIFLEALFREQFNMLELYARHFVKNRADAQDVVQEAFRIACGKIDALTGSPNPAGWMKLAVKNTALNLLRQRRRQAELLEALGAVSPRAASGPEQDGVFEQCAQAVPKEELRLFLRVALEGFSYREAAEAAHISLWACYKRVKRTEERLRVALTGERGGHGDERT